jgi:Abnormal spindle-like microcephaly-assoc'd, ASPM-SPD-2-Hydin
VYPAAGDFNGDHQTDVIVHDDLGNSVITLLNTGVVTFSPTTPLNFGQQATGTTSAPKSVSLTNTGTSTLTISSLTVKGQFNLSSTTCHAQVAPGANCSISVTFSPQTAGSTSGLVSITDSARRRHRLLSFRVRARKDGGSCIWRGGRFGTTDDSPGAGQAAPENL